MLDIHVKKISVMVPPRDGAVGGWPCRPCLGPDLISRPQRVDQQQQIMEEQQ